MTVAAVAYDPLSVSGTPHARAAREQADWLQSLKVGGLAPRTIADYRRATDNALRMFPDKAFEDFTPGDLTHVLALFPAASRHTRRAGFTSWFQWGWEQRLIDEDPMKRVRKAKRQPRRHVETYSEAEVERMCSLPFPDGALLTILFESGIRKSEARQLRPMDFKPDRGPHGHLIVLDGKGGKDRVIVASRKLKAALTELAVLENIEPRQHYWYRVNAGNGYRHVLRDKPVGEGTFHRWWVNAVEEAGVRYLKPHTTRHTFATRLRREGVPIEHIQRLLGHSSIQTTMDEYVHTDISDIERDMADLL